MAKVTDEEIVVNFRQTGADDTIKKVEKLVKTITKLNIQYNKNKSKKGRELPTDETAVEASIIRSFNRQTSALGSKKAVTKYRTILSRQTASLFSEPYQSARAEAKGLSLDQHLKDQEETLRWQKEHINEIVSLEKERDAINEEIARKTGKQQTLLKKLGRTFTRIGFYRIARLTFSTIEKGLSQGISDYAKFDASAGNTMSSLASSSKIISSSIATILMPALKVIEPVVKWFATGLAQIANTINALGAKMKGVTDYSRINLEYWEEYNKEVNKSLLSFDKFETLSGGDDSKSPFEQGTAETLEQDLGGFLEGLNKIYSIIQLIGETALLRWIIKDNGFSNLLRDTDKLNSKLETGAENIEKSSKASLGWKANLAGVLTLINDITSFITNLIYAIQHWDDMKTSEKIMTVLKLIAVAIGAILTGIAIFTKNAKLLVAGISVSAVGAALPTKFAEGGVPDKGSLFYAGEAGAELVHSMPSGNTGVTNVAQFKEAMKEALQETGYGSGKSVAQLNINGREFATAVFNDFDYTGKRLTGAGWGGAV